MKCDICELRCDIGPGSHGRCDGYQASPQGITPRFRDQISTFSVGRMEDVPILHFHPGSLCLLIGTVGCNFDCSYCTNSHLLRCGDDSSRLFHMSPKQLVSKAKSAGCCNIAFSINEPAVSLAFFLDIAGLARENKIGIGCATNGYFTVESAHELAEHIDFANVSLKAISDDFYRRVCRVPSVGPVLRNIELLHRKKVHLEITTPVTDDMSRDDVGRMAEFIGGIDRRIPWHLFRLLPEYRMEDEPRPLVEGMLAMRDAASKHLDYVYIGNLVGSRWMDTLCPSCGVTLIRRINASGCGSIVADCSMREGMCPHCGAAIPIVGLPGQHMTTEVCFPPPLTDADEPMLGLLDAQGYTRMLDLRTGDTANCESALVSTVAEVIGRRPYPGDNRQESDTWVTDVALELVKSYPAELVMLHYAQALFIAVNRGEDRRRALENVFNNVQRFLAATDHVPLIFGCGGLESIEEVVDLEDLFEAGDSFALTSGKYAHIDAAQMERLEPRKRSRLEQLAKVLTRKEFLGSLEGSFSPQFAEDLGDYVAVAKAGVVFRGLGSLGRQHRYAMALHDTVSVHTLLEAPRSICDVAPIVRREVAKGVKVALIIVEGADAEDFPFPTKDCQNRSGEFVYQTPWQQYYTLSTGIPYYRYHSPLSNRHWMQDNRYYPFAGRLRRPANGALGQSIGARRSLAAGNRSINTHVFLGADVSVECYCCYMHNHGSLAVFRGKALWKG